MHRVRMLLGSLHQQHISCVDGVRRYMAHHELEWDLRLISEADVHNTDSDAWWVLFHQSALPLLPPAAARRHCILFPPAEDESIGCCVFEQGAFGRLAVRHLWGQGYRTIGVVDGRPDPRWQIRRQAVKQACQDHDLHFTAHTHTDPAHVDSLVTWLRSSPQPLAIYAYTDQQASWLRDVALTAGLRIPNDVAILGTSDLPKYCVNRNPTLSSIAYPWPLMGEVAGAHIHHLIQGVPPPPPTVLRPMTVSTRESTAARGIADPLVRRAHAWLRKHLASKRPLQDAADHCQCSVQTLCTHFHRELGTTPKQAHDRMRCERAVELLADPHRSITDIARNAGFGSVTAFGIAFKRRHGCSPTRWREAAR